MKITNNLINKFIKIKPISTIKNINRFYSNKVYPFEIGRGGFGIVYLNKNKYNKSFVTKKNELPIAIKDIKIAYNEINFLSICDNINIPKLYNYDIQQKNNYFNYIINMEYFKGDDLYNLLFEKKKTLKVHDIFKYIKDISETLNYIHNLGYIYCDLKIENIIITNNGAKIVDFGQVRKKNSNIPKQITTPSYLPIECISSKKNFVEKSDYWCLGIIILICVYNIHPFYSSSRYNQNSNDLIKNSNYIINDIFKNAKPVIIVDNISLKKIQKLILNLINNDLENRYDYNNLKNDIIWLELFNKSYNDF
jgi:serine/threonine protein kinase